MGMRNRAVKGDSETRGRLLPSDLIGAGAAGVSKDGPMPLR